MSHFSSYAPRVQSIVELLFKFQFFSSGLLKLVQRLILRIVLYVAKDGRLAVGI